MPSLSRETASATKYFVLMSHCFNVFFIDSMIRNFSIMHLIGPLAGFVWAHDSVHLFWRQTLLTFIINVTSHTFKIFLFAGNGIKKCMSRFNQDVIRESTAQHFSVRGCRSNYKRIEQSIYNFLQCSYCTHIVYVFFYCRRFEVNPILLVHMKDS